MLKNYVFKEGPKQQTIDHCVCIDHIDHIVYKYVLNYIPCVQQQRLDTNEAKLPPETFQLFQKQLDAESMPHNVVPFHGDQEY